MAKDLTNSGRLPDRLDTLRAADADRHQVAEQLKGALDEGRLTLAEYDDRVGQAYAARTYAELLTVVDDLPRPGLNAAEVTARQLAEQRRAERRMPLALVVLWTIWAAVAGVNVTVWALTEVMVPHDIYPWWIWTLPPGVALLVVTVGVQTARRQQRRR